MGLWIFRPGFSRIAVLGLSIIVIMLLMSFLRFDPPVAPVWQLTLLVLAMLLFTFMSVLVGWNSLFLVSGHWRLAPALAFLPFLGVGAVLFGPAFSWELRDPIMIVVVLGAGACSVGLSAALVLVQGRCRCPCRGGLPDGLDLVLPDTRVIPSVLFPSAPEVLRSVPPACG